MDYSGLRKLRDKFYFTVEDLSEIWGIKLESAQVLCSRYVKKGLFLRLKRNFYVLDERWENLSNEDFLKITNFLQVPSYISFMSALSVHGLTTQVQRRFFESACLKRSVRFACKEASFSFYKLKKQLFFKFVKTGDIFIATKEKAFIDSVYLYSFGKYKLDFSSLDLDVLDKNETLEILKAFPQKTTSIVRKLCRI